MSDANLRIIYRMKWCGAIAVIFIFSTIQYSRGLTKGERLFGDLKVNETSEGGVLSFRAPPLKTNETTDTKLEHASSVRKLKLQQRSESFQAARVLTYKSSSVDINVQLVVYPATSTSVSISWNATVNRFYVNHYSQESFKNIGLKIIYRPFGSVLESEIILLMETAESQTSFNFSSEYSIENLLPINGYIFCFSIALQKDEIIQHARTETLVSEESTPFLNKPSSGFDQENIEDHNFFPNKDFTFGYVPTLHDHRLPPSDSNIKHPINPFISSLLQKPFESLPNRKQNVAYSSTGELIYLPSSSWSPFSRRRRTLNYLRGTLLQEGIKNENDTYCLEIFTGTDTAGDLNHIGFIIIAVTIFGISMFIIVTIVILVKFLQCCKLYSGPRKENESIDIHPEVETNAVNPNSANDQPDDALPSETNTEENDSSISQIVKNCINSSNQFVKSGYASSECTHNLSKLSTGIEEDFHPGYEIPPSSMVEVYGYDFPRPLNRASGHPLSPTPSSCELNDHVTDFNWDKYNLDIPGKENNKKITNSDSEENFRKALNKFETYLPSIEKEGNGHRKKSRPPSYEAFRQSKDCAKDVGDFRFSEESLSPKISDKLDYRSSLSESHPGRHDIYCKKRCIGDIIVTGGTLIEVPEGYARPATQTAASESSVLRIVVS